MNDKAADEDPKSARNLESNKTHMDAKDYS